jgi:mRNA interferase HicA
VRETIIKAPISCGERDIVADDKPPITHHPSPKKNPRMKRTELIKYLKKCGAHLLREESRHRIYQKEQQKTQVPRHNEIVDDLARKICKDLKIPFVR